MKVQVEELRLGSSGGLRETLPRQCLELDQGVSENRGPSTLHSRILIVRTPKKGTLIFGKSHIASIVRMGRGLV